MDWRVGVAALDALDLATRAGALESASAVDLALPRLTKGHWRQRERAAKVVSYHARDLEAARPGAVKALARMALRDPNGFARQAAVEGLDRYPGAAARAALEGAVDDPAAPVRETACLALGRRKGTTKPAACPRVDGSKTPGP